MAATSFKAVLVIGPTGHVGKALCAALMAHKQLFNRIAFFNDSSRAATQEKLQLFAAFQSGGMEEVRGKYADIEAFRGFDCVMMPLGNHAIKFQPTIIDSAIAAGVRHFYPSEWGADITAGSNWHQRYYRDKVVTRLHLEARGQPNDTPDLGWTLILVGRLTEYGVIRHFGIDNTQHTAEIYGTPDGRQSLLSTRDTVAFTLATLRDGNASANARRSFRFHGESPSWVELFQRLQAVTGHKYVVTYRDVEAARVKEAKAKELGDVEMELEASHQLIQGRQGTLLPLPFDNSRFPDIRLESVNSALQRLFADPTKKSFLGLEGL